MLKIAFLFLTIGAIYHELPWINYLKGHEQNYSLYVHPKEPFAASFFSSAIVPQRKKTTWANTMKAQIALLKEALQDPHNTKFVFVSESTLPLTTFDEMYQRLTSDERSQFFYRKNPFGNRTFKGLPPSQVYNNPQWIILNRKHAHLMVEDTKLIKILAKRPHDQEHYPSTLLAYHHELDQVIKKDATLCIWEGHAHPHEFKDLATDPHTKRLYTLIKKKRFLFGRKFHKNCDLTLLQPYLPHLF